MKPSESRSAPPRPPSRQRAPLSTIGLGHPNAPTLVPNITAPLNVKKQRPRMSTKPLQGSLSDPFISKSVSHNDLNNTVSHNELKTILADPPRRRASTSATEALNVPPTQRSVSAPVLPSRVIPDSYKSATETTVSPEDLNKVISDLMAQVNSTSGQLADLQSTITHIKEHQVSNEDVLNGIKMMIEFFNTARTEDRKWVTEMLEAALAAVDTEVVGRLKAQGEIIVKLKKSVETLTEEREAAKQHNTDLRALLEVTNPRLANVEALLANKDTSKTKDLEDAKAEIAKLRQELALAKEPKNEQAPYGPVPPTPRKPTHKRTASSSPVIPGMYPRVSALRREAMENAMTRANGALPVPSLPAIVPLSPFAFRFNH